MIERARFSSFLSWRWMSSSTQPKRRMGEITWVALIALSQNYMAATSDMQRAADVVAATYAIEITSVSAPVYGSAILLIWPFIASLVMLKGIFNRATAYVGIAGSIVGLVYVISLFVPALAMFLIIETPLCGIWFLLVGYGLYRLGRQ